nr:MAG TPA: hypothetical protein [Caudoviricetes sp.]
MNFSIVKLRADYITSIIYGDKYFGYAYTLLPATE